MFDPKVLLKAIPSFWSSRFGDVNLLETLYSFIGEYLSDAYADALNPLAAMSLQSTPLKRHRTWGILPLANSQRFEVAADSDSGTSLVIYGLRESEYILVSCHRIYKTPSLKPTDYLESGKDFELLDVGSEDILAIANSSGNQAFFSRFSRYLVFYSADPLDYFGNGEPERPLGIYPLAFKVAQHRLEGATNEQILASGLTISSGDRSTGARLLDVYRQSGQVYLLVHPESFYPDSAYMEATIEGLPAGAIRADAVKNYTLEVKDINVWAYDCEIDKLDLYRKWGHLIDVSGQSRPTLRSNELYYGLLNALLEANLLGLSGPRLEKLANLLGGTRYLEFSSLNDTLLTLDLVESRLITALTEYRISAFDAIDIRILRSTQSVQTANKRISMSDCVLLNIGDSVLIRTIGRYVQGGSDYSVTIEDGNGLKLGTAILMAEPGAILVELEGTSLSMFQGPLRAYYTDQKYLDIPETLYSTSALTGTEDFSADIPINPVCRVYDYNSGLLSLVDSGVFLPSTIWEVPESDRREIATNVTPHVVGSMPRHRVGDYELRVPGGSSAEAFDYPNSLNPNGHAWPTSYKLMQDFLLTKIAVISPVVGNSGSSIRSTLAVANRVKDASKSIIPLLNRDLVEFVPQPLDELDVAVSAPLAEELMQAQSYAGIGSLGFTLLITSDFGISSTPAVTNIRIVSTGVTYPVTLLGWEPSKLLLEVGGDTVAFLTALEQNSSLEINVNALYEPVDQVTVSTNFVGSESTLMVVGGSYPEYTDIYTHGPNTVSEWLQIGVE
jgi:hypothetical protein